MIIFELLTHYRRCFSCSVYQKRINNYRYWKTSVFQAVFDTKGPSKHFSLSPCTWLSSDF